ncbi:hypothetical protein RCL1_000433 [Eukaryota sp. TZLM3-RCL]
MKYTNFEEFSLACEQMFTQDPSLFRFMCKFHHSKGQLHLKATDNTRTLNYRTDQAADLKKAEALNAKLLRLMSREKSD